MAVEKQKVKTFDMVDARAIKAIKGTSFLIYNASGARKTRTLGTIPNGNFTLHISFDSGSSSATSAADLLGITEAEHKVTVPQSLQEFGEIINALLAHPAYNAKIDNIVIDNLVIITSLIQSFVATSPKYAKDALHISDAFADDTDKNPQGSKTLAYYNDVQRVTRELVFQILQLTDSYNVFLLAGEVQTTDKDGAPIVTVAINGPKSINPVVSMFSEVYRTSFKQTEFDSADKIVTKFKIDTYTDTLTGMKYFGKTRNIKDVNKLTSGEMVADFREIFKEIGYVAKKDRVKVVA